MSGSRRPALADDATAATFARRQLKLAALSAAAMVLILAAVGVTAFVVQSTNLVLLAVMLGLVALVTLLALCGSQLAQLTAFALRRKVS